MQDLFHVLIIILTFEVNFPQNPTPIMIDPISTTPEVVEPFPHLNFFAIHKRKIAFYVEYYKKQ